MSEDKKKMTESPKNPMHHHHHFNHHQQLYKSPINVADMRKKASSSSIEASSNEAAAEPLSWRSAYKKRCLEETKKSRQKLLHKFRNIQLNESGQKEKLDVYLDNELQKIFVSEAHNMVSIEEALEMYNEMRREIMDMVMNEYLEQESNEIRDLDSENHRVVCPLCQKENLTTRNGLIECQNFKCQFTVDASVCDLDELARRLESASQQHPCDQVPKFCFRFLDDDMENSLFIYCESCNYFKRIC